MIYHHALRSIALEVVGMRECAVRRTLGLLLVLCSGAFAGPLAAQAATGSPVPAHVVAGASSCSPTALSPPRLVTGSAGHPIYVESPLAVAARGGIVLLGSPAIEWLSASVFASIPRPA